MPRRRRPSDQTLLVLRVLAARSGEWTHGYDVARETGLRSGSLYPILARLADGGLLEARWEPDPPPGRPRRHLYRSTAEGARAAADRAEAAGRATPALAGSALP